tara:strand:- start:29695 stop:30108 length:414 start_codon:yes stop_codon:yes gene_type:complete
MRVTVGGRYWALFFVRSLPSMWGVTDSPKRKNKSIRIRRRLGSQDLLDTLIHELLHAAEWDAGEEWVDKIGTHTALVLTLAGWGRNGGEVGSITDLSKMICACLRLSKLYLDHDKWAIQTSNDIATILWKLGWRLNK